MALGAGETTVLRMTTAYSMFANGGRRIKPTLIDRIQDRWGQTIYGTTSASASVQGDAWRTRTSRFSSTSASRCSTR
jgi:penicillin-binding protein 1A